MVVVDISDDKDIVWRFIVGETGTHSEGGREGGGRGRGRGGGRGKGGRDGVREGGREGEGE